MNVHELLKVKVNNQQHTPPMQILITFCVVNGTKRYKTGHHVLNKRLSLIIFNSLVIVSGVQYARDDRTYMIIHLR